MALEPLLKHHFMAPRSKKVTGIRSFQTATMSLKNYIRKDRHFTSCNMRSVQVRVVGVTRLPKRTNNTSRDLQFLWESLWTTVTCGMSRRVAFTDVSELHTASIFGTVLRNVSKRLPDYTALHSSKWWDKAKTKLSICLYIWHSEGVCFENEDFKLTASTRAPTMGHTSLLVA